MNIACTLLRKIVREILSESILTPARVENSVVGFYGAPVYFDNWDLALTKEFGYHFALGDESQSLHRLRREKSPGFLWKVRIEFKNALRLQDPGRWTLETVLRQLDFESHVIDSFMAQASSTARKNFTSFRMEQNILLAKILSDLEYDAIIYLNRGEGGGQAIIIWNPEQIHTLGVQKVIK